MTRKIISVVLLISFSFYIFASCSGEQEGIQDPKINKSTIEGKLEQDQALKELLKVREEIIQRGLSRGVNGNQIKAAYINNDLDKLNNLFGYNRDEIEALNLKIQTLVQSLENRYPEIKTKVEKRKDEVCFECSINEIAAKWDKELMIYEGRMLYSPERGPIKCRWVNLVVDLTLCLFMPNPVLWALCTYKSICGNCEGGVLDDICL